MLRGLKYIICMSQLSSGKVEKVSGIFPHLDSYTYIPGATYDGNKTYTSITKSRKNQDVSICKAKTHT